MKGKMLAADLGMAALKLAIDRDLLQPCEAGPSVPQVMGALPHLVCAASHVKAC